MIAIQKATRAQTKDHNKRLIFSTIYDQERVSRADIARLTRLTRPTVSNTVAELIEAGLVEEVGQGPSAGGKPPILLSVAARARHLIGIDLANSHFRGGLLDLRGNIIHRVNVPVGERDGEEALALVYELVDQMMAAVTRPLLGIGIGSPGLMDARHGIVRRSVNLNWQDLPLRQLLESRYELPVYLANDTHLAALAEYTFGDGPERANLVVIKAGRGISAGIVLNGQLYYGDGFGAGEIGHIMVVEAGESCLCGRAGCLETVASSRAIIRQAQEVARRHPHGTLAGLASQAGAMTTEVVLQACEAGDAEVRQIIYNVGRYLGLAVANLVGALNIQRIVLAGSLARFGPALLEPACHEMLRRALPALTEGTSLSLSRLGQDIVIQGAGALLLSEELGLV